jgi:hypothetical protein
MKKLILASTLFFAPLPAASAAAFSFAIAPGVMYSPPGGLPNSECANFATLSCLLFSGSLTPDTSQDLFLTDIQISFSNDPLNNLSGNSDFFFCTTATSGLDCPPGLLAKTDPVYSGQIFEIDIDPAALPGIYHGTATILGGGIPGDTFILGTPQSFTVVITPEPSTAWFACGALGVAFFARRKRVRV